VKKYDWVVIGGGLVGLSTAYQALRANPGAAVCVLEKEPTIASHQSTRNSGVIHTGVYYKPESYKAKLCVRGRRALLDFVQQKGVAHSICGKLIVATSAEQMQQVQSLYERAQKNGVRVQLLSAEAMREREPFVAGVGGLLVPDAGVVDFGGLAKALIEEIHALGGEVRLQAEVRRASRRGNEWLLEGSFAELACSFVVNCAGLYSDRIAEAFDAKPVGRIVPFRGEYYVLRESARKLCNALIYPVPDPRFPFLGVHFTRRFDGSVECGPNAVLALAREGYSWSSCNARDLAEMIGYGGFRRLIQRHWKMGAGEMYRSLSKAAFVRALQKLVPAVTAQDLLPGGAGVRAQVVQPNGDLEQDFAFMESPGSLHVLSAPSPAATSCLVIAEEVMRRATQASSGDIFDHPDRVVTA
jgi:L-2-hydroxyglutarate oxidase